MIRRFLITIFFSSVAWSFLIAKDTTFLEASAKPGDGVYSFLRRYALDNYSCNFEKFYKLNKLSRNAKLIVGRTYKLPVIVYKFNGKTIRSTIGIDNWDLAIRIQTYNEEMLEQELREKSFKKDNILWVPFHELNCPKQDLEIPNPDQPKKGKKDKKGNKKEEEKDLEPPASPADKYKASEKTSSTNKPKNRIFPIFGPDYEYTPLKSQKLLGKVFYVVGGHGGPDPGAVGKRSGRKLCEDEYAYDVSLRLCRHLVANGATAYMITRDDNDGIRNETFLKCDTDDRLWGGVRMVRRHKPRLFQRSDIVNDLYKRHSFQGVTDQLAIMIHVDSRTGLERTDLYFYHHPDSQESKKVAQKLRKTMVNKYKHYQKGRKYAGTVTARDLHMLRETAPLSVYVELANILNTVDQQRIVVPKNRQYLADWLFEGILTAYTK